MWGKTCLKTGYVLLVSTTIGFSNLVDTIISGYVDLTYVLLAGYHAIFLFRLHVLVLFTSQATQASVTRVWWFDDLWYWVTGSGWYGE